MGAAKVVRKTHQTIPTRHSGSRGRKIFCPNDQRVLIWNPDLRKFFCPECQFGIEPDPERLNSPYAPELIVTMDGDMSGNTNERGQPMKFRPAKSMIKDNKKRYPGDDQPWEDDPDMKAIEKAGGRIIDYRETS